MIPAFLDLVDIQDQVFLVILALQELVAIQELVVIQDIAVLMAHQELVDIVA